MLVGCFPGIVSCVDHIRLSLMHQELNIKHVVAINYALKRANVRLINHIDTASNGFAMLLLAQATLNGRVSVCLCATAAFIGDTAGVTRSTPSFGSACRRPRVQECTRPVVGAVCASSWACLFVCEVCLMV